MKYASVYRRSGSPYWWCSFLDPDTGKRRSQSTKIVVDDPGSRARAREWANERSKIAIDAGPTDASAWPTWVPQFLKEHYVNPASIKISRICWRRWFDFLVRKKLRVPRAVTLNHVLSYAAERRSEGITANTVGTEIAYFSRIMVEAVRRGFCPTNPCSRHGLRRSTPKEKREITPEEDAIIREALKAEPEWMRISYEIAMAQGCRLHETSLPLSDIDEKRRVITFRVKGGRDHGTALHPKLLPLIKRLRDAGRKTTCDLPAQASLRWHEFFKKHGMTHLSFHCTRVTVVTRLARAGVPLAQAMAFVGHSSSLVHRLYTRLRPADLSLATDALK